MASIERKRKTFRSYEELREQGMSHDEAREYLEPIFQEAGFIDADINRYFLRRNLDFVQRQYRPSIINYATFGWQGSLPGLMVRDRMPDAVSHKDLEHATLSDRVAMSIGTMAGDIVPLLAASPVAAAAGVPTGGSGAVAVGAAAFGLIEAAKASRMYRLQHGYTDIADYWDTLPDDVKVRLSGMSREQRTRFVLSPEWQNIVDNTPKSRDRGVNTEMLLDVAKHGGTGTLIGASMPIVGGIVGKGASRFLAPQQTMLVRSAESSMSKVGLSGKYIADLKAGRTDAFSAAKDFGGDELRRKLVEGGKILTEADINQTVTNAQARAVVAASRYSQASKQQASMLSKFSPLPDVAKVGAESAAMAYIGAGVEGRFPSQQEMIDSAAFMLAAHYGQKSVVSGLNGTMRKMGKVLVGSEASIAEISKAVIENPALLDNIIRQENIPEEIQRASSAYRKSVVIKNAESDGIVSTPLEGEGVTRVDALMSSISNDGLAIGVQGAYGLSGSTPLDVLPARDQQILRDTGLVESVPMPDGTTREYISFRHLEKEVNRRFDVLEKSAETKEESSGTETREPQKSESEAAVESDVDDGVYFLEEKGRGKKQKKEKSKNEQTQEVDERALEEDAEALRQKEKQEQDQEYRNLSFDVADEITSYERRMDLAIDSGLIDLFKDMGFSENEANSSALLWAASAENLCQLFDMTPKEFIWGYTAKYIKMTEAEFDALPQTGLKGMYERRMAREALVDAGIDINDRDSLTKRRRAVDPEFDSIYGVVDADSVAELFGSEVVKELRDEFGPRFFAKKGEGQRIENLAENFIREKFGIDYMDVNIDSNDISNFVQRVIRGNREYFGLNQKRGNTVRGGYLEEGNIIGLFEKADVSTIMHETAHHWLSVIKDAASMKDANAYTRDLWDRLQDAYGFAYSDVNDPLRWRIFQERFAKNFEAYLREGRAPSQELQPVFSVFRDWLKRIYKTVKTLLGDEQLSEDVRGIFDSILAEEGAIANSPRKKKKVESRTEVNEREFVGDDFMSRLSEIEERGNREIEEARMLSEHTPPPEANPSVPSDGNARDNLPAIVDRAIEAVERSVGYSKGEGRPEETFEQLLDRIEAAAIEEEKGAAPSSASSTSSTGGVPSGALTSAGAGGGGTGTPNQGVGASSVPGGGGSGGTGSGNVGSTTVRPISNQGAYPPRRGLRILGSVINYFGGRVTAKDATSIASIIEGLAEALNVPLRFGDMSRKGRFIRGYYNSKLETIRVKLFNDITTFAHEAGHRVQHIAFGDMSEKPLKPFENELLPLATAGKKPLNEGFAEFVARFICNPSNAQSVAPNFYDYFLNSLFKTEEGLAVLTALKNAQVGYERWGSQGGIMRNMSNIRFHNLVGEDGIFNMLMNPRESWTSFQRAWYDRAIDIRNLRDEVNRQLRAQGKELSAEDDPYILFRTFQGVAGKVAYFMEHSPFDFKTLKDSTLPDGSPAPSLKSIYQEAERIGSLEEFSTYLVSRRSLELRGRNIETGTRAMDDVVTVRALHDRYKGVAEKIDQYQNFLLQYLVDSGVISNEAKNVMQSMNKYYVPFFRVTENERLGISGSRKNAKSTSSLQAGGELQGIRGSTRTIHDPLESVIMNTYALMMAADKNMVGRAIVDSASSVNGMGNWVEKIDSPIVAVNVRRADAVREIINSMPVNDASVKGVLRQLLNTGTVGDEILTLFRNGNNIDKNKQIVVFRDGKSEYWQVAPELASVFHGLEVETVPWFIRTIAAAPARMLRAGATWVPEFWIRNYLSDSLMAGIQSRTGYKPFIDTNKGAKHTWKQDEVYKMWLKGGGSQAGMVNRSRRSFQQMRDDFARIHWHDVAWNVVSHPLRSVANALRGVGEFSESMTRVGEFARGLERFGNDKAGIIRAAYESRDLIDYARHGKYVPIVGALIPFFNAQIQGMVRIAEGLRENPKAFLARTALSVVVPSILLAIRNHYDEDLQSRTNAVEKNMYWLVRIPGTDTIVKIRKPFELGVVVGSGFENAVEYALSELDQIGKDKKVSSSLLFEDAFSGYVGASVDSVTPNLVPTIALPAVENWANRTVFMDRPLIGRRLEGILPEHQYTMNTSEVSKALSRTIGRLPGMSEVEAFSPIAIDNWIHSWTARGGQHVLNLLDYSGSRLDLLPSSPEIARRLEDFPVIRSFVVRHPSMNSKPVQRFFERSKQLEMYLKTINHLKSDDDAREKLRDFLDDGEYVTYRNTKDALSKATKAIAGIRSNRNLSPGEKRDMIEKLYIDCVNAAKRGNMLLNDIDPIVRELRERARLGDWNPD